MDIANGTLHVIGEKEILDRRLPHILCSFKYALEKTPELWPAEHPKVDRVTDEYLAVSFKTQAGYMPPLTEPPESQSLPIDLSVSSDGLFFLYTWVDERENFRNRHAYLAVDYPMAGSPLDREQNARQFIMAVKQLNRALRAEGSDPLIETNAIPSRNDSPTLGHWNSTLLGSLSQLNLN